MSAPATVAPASGDADSEGDSLGSRFLVVAVACQRVVQLRNGARMHVALTGHKPCMVAVAEVVAGTVPYTLA